MTVPSTGPQQNWAGNLRYGAREIVRPRSIAEAQAAVSRETRVRPLGTRHSFSTIADSPGVLLELDGLPTVLDIDADRMRVSVSAGTTYGLLGVELERCGLALRNTGSLPHISVAGACAVATHGSGDTNGNLATAVIGVQLITADGSLVELSRESDPRDFDGIVVSLSALGVFTRLDLSIEPTFEVRQDVYEGLSWERLEQNFDAITSFGYSVSLFTKWTDQPLSRILVKSRRDQLGSECPPEELFGARPIGARPPNSKRNNLTNRDGSFGPWNERLPHFRSDANPSHGNELQSEYFIAREHATAAFAALRSMAGRIHPLLIIGEIRTVAADSLWLSPSYGMDAVALHFTWTGDSTAVTALLPELEEALADFSPRPHWGKLFARGIEDIAPLYERHADFVRLAERFDPRLKFHNRFLERNVLPRDKRFLDGP
ncbi:MAG TPA: FAD-binding protein [Mycobacteriales bacterium]|nr:FAD-binding protein [Mycobacteriales bacterium]